MTTFLLRRFVRDWETPDAPGVRAAVGRLSGITGILCNLLLFAAKLLIGLLSGSLSICADAMNNLSDAASAIVTLIGFRLAEKPADADHPFGHARFEYLSGLAVAGLIMVIGFELAKTSVAKILHPAPVQFSLPLVLVLCLSIGAKLWLFAFNRRLGTHIDSQTLIATATDSRNDVLTTSAVFAAILIERATSWQVDGWMGLVVALFILYSSVDLAKSTISPLLGESADPALRRVILETVDAHPLVLGYHDLMVHDYGPGQRFASLHVEMDSREDPLRCHEVIDDLERKCYREHNIHLVIHYDPVVLDDAAQNEMRDHIRSLLFRYDERLSFHDLRMVPGARHINLMFDISLPEELMRQQDQIRAFIDRELNEAGEMRFHIKITFDPEGFNQR